MAIGAYRLWIISSLVGPFLVPAPVWAHGVVGKRLFVEPIVAEDANVFSEYDLLVPSYLRGGGTRELDLGSSLTLRLTENLGIEIAGDWISANPDIGPTETGFANPEFTLKYAAHVSAPHEWIATVALSVEPPLGADRVGAESFSSLGTGVFYGKGFGDLPEGLRYLRPLMLQGDLVLHHHLTRDGAEAFNPFSYDFALYYSLPYLQQNVKDVGIPWPLSRLFPMVELNFERMLNGPEIGLKESFARPGFVWVGKAFQLGLAAVIPISDLARQTSDIGVMGIMSLYLDDLFPDVFRKPVFER